MPDLPQRPGDVSVQVDQSGHDQGAGRVNDSGGAPAIDAAPDLCDHAILDGNVRDGVQVPAGIEHPSVGDKQVHCFWLVQGCALRSPPA